MSATDWYEDCLADALVALGRYDEAILEYQRAGAKFPGMALTRYHLAVVYDRQGKLDLARAEFQRFLKEWKNADPGAGTRFGRQAVAVGGAVSVPSVRPAPSVCGPEAFVAGRAEHPRLVVPCRSSPAYCVSAPGPLLRRPWAWSRQSCSRRVGGTGVAGQGEAEEGWGSYILHLRR